MNYTTGDVIKFLRKRAGMSQEELGAVLGVKRGTVQKYENNSIALGIDTIKALSIQFQVLPYIFVFPEAFETEAILELERERTQKILKLNNTGKQKVMEYLDDIYLIDMYRS